MIHNSTVIDYKTNTVVNKNIIFLHIPKTGGTSIEFLLRNKFGKSEARHYNIKRIQEHYNISDITNYQIFTAIRNPFYRIYSTWTHQHHSWTKENAISFPEYIENIQRYFNGEFDINTDDGSSQYLRVLDKEGIVLLDAQHIEKFDWWVTAEDNTLVGYDFLRFESLNQDWDKYKSTLGIAKRLPHLNSTKTVHGTDYMDEYDSETYDIVSNIYKDEIKLFGYA